MIFMLIHSVDVTKLSLDIVTDVQFRSVTSLVYFRTCSNNCITSEISMYVNGELGQKRGTRRSFGARCSVGARLSVGAAMSHLHGCQYMEQR